MYDPKPREPLGRYIKRKVKGGYLAKKFEQAVAPTKKPRPSSPKPKLPIEQKRGESVFQMLKRTGSIPKSTQSGRSVGKGRRK